jgi:hypothetical protein
MTKPEGLSKGVFRKREEKMVEKQRRSSTS